MPPPRAVVVPFGVPEEGRGLGLGLAALVQAGAQFDGGPPGVAQLQGRRKSEPPDAPLSTVEALVAPDAWRGLASRGDLSPGDVRLVITGAFEPPWSGTGALQMLAFDPRDGASRGKVEARIDPGGAGDGLVDALTALCEGAGGQIDGLASLRGLEWEVLESVLRAERCALHDPQRGGPHDPLAAMLHLGRAIGEAPQSRWPVERLSTLALSTALGPRRDPKLAAAAARALERAADDAPAYPELVEALSTLMLSLGRPRAAAQRLAAALEGSPGRTSARLLLARCLRAVGAHDEALGVLRAADGDPDGVGLTTELGAVQAARGDLDAARETWRRALDRHPMHPGPFGGLASLALRSQDVPAAQRLVDAVLDAPGAPVEVVRKALELTLGTEADGLPRASRVAALCDRLLAADPRDLGASLLLARAQLTRGEPDLAAARALEIERQGPGTLVASEAQLLRHQASDPTLDARIRRLLALSVSPAEAGLSRARDEGRRLAGRGIWVGWLVVARAERKLGRLDAAREALETAVSIAPGASAAHHELAELLLQLDHPAPALDHARKVVTLQGATPATLALVARAEQRLAEPPGEPARPVRPWAERFSAAWRALTRR